MKLRFWDRVITALTGLLAVLAGVGMILHITGLVSFGMLQGRLQGVSQNVLRIAVVIVGAVLILLGIHGVGMLFRRRKDKGFVIQRTDLGDMSISMKALEGMAKRCVSIYPDMAINSTRIYRSRDGISVELKVTLASGMNIPLTVNALQKQIKQYITSCSGIDVHEVRVRVDTDVAKLAAPAPVAVVEAPAAQPVAEEPVAENAAEQICQHKEEPQPVQEMQAVEESPAEEPAAEEPEPIILETAEETIPCGEVEEAAEEESEAKEAEEVFDFEPIQFDEEAASEAGEANA